MLKKAFEIGQEVFIIERNLNISKKEIVAILKEERETKYKVDVKSCGGVNENDFFLTKGKAEAKKQDFLDCLKFKVGDLIIFKYNNYSHKDIQIGRIKQIIYNEGNPYEVRTAFNCVRDLCDKEIALKINNSYIENYGRLQDLKGEFEELRKKMSCVLEEINKEHNKLEKDLKKSFKREFKWYRVNKVPLFRDRFDYEEKDY